MKTIFILTIFTLAFLTGCVTQQVNNRGQNMQDVRELRFHDKN